MKHFIQLLSEHALGNWITADSKLVAMMLWLAENTGNWEPAQTFTLVTIFMPAIIRDK